MLYWYLGIGALIGLVALGLKYKGFIKGFKLVQWKKKWVTPIVNIVATAIVWPLQLVYCIYLAVKK